MPQSNYKALDQQFRKTFHINKLIGFFEAKHDMLKHIGNSTQQSSGLEKGYR